MDWLTDVEGRLRRKNQILFAKDSPYLQELLELFQRQTHRTLVLWAFDLAAESVAALEKKYPGERRPGEALRAARDWAAGEIKMPLAQRKILDCHAFAKEISCRADIATCHAIGQACGVVHTVGHAIGYPVYDLTSLVYKFGLEHCREPVEFRRAQYVEKLLYWRTRSDDEGMRWANFMLR